MACVIYNAHVVRNLLNAGAIRKSSSRGLVLSKANVEVAIKRVQKHIAAFQPDPPKGRIQANAPANNHESSTRYMLIDPVLRALGWDLSDPSDCVVEYPMKTPPGRPAARVDYVLKDTSGKPVIVIEAKRIDVESDDDEALKQMERYLKGIPTATVAVVTNGQYWTIARREGNSWEAESRRPLGIHYEKTDENAQRLWDCLSKESVNQPHSKQGNSFRSSARNRFGRRR